MEGRRYELWWSGRENGVGGVSVMVKEKLCEKVVVMRRVNDIVVAVVLFF